MDVFCVVCVIIRIIIFTTTHHFLRRQRTHLHSLRHRRLLTLLSLPQRHPQRQLATRVHYVRHLFLPHLDSRRRQDTPPSSPADFAAPSFPHTQPPCWLTPTRRRDSTRATVQSAQSRDGRNTATALHGKKRRELREAFTRKMVGGSSDCRKREMR